jgi:hypothetical protein
MAPTMRRFTYPLAIGLVACPLASEARAAAVSVLPDRDCPASLDVEARLEQLGELSALARLGSAEIAVDEPALRVSFRDTRGEPLGVRVVTAGPDCQARVVLAAAVIAAFAGEWTKTELAEPPAANSRAGAGSPTALPQPRNATPWQAELGAMAFGVRDSDSGTFGLAGRADLGRGALRAAVLVEGTWPRQRPLGAGQGDYRFLRAGLGPGLRLGQGTRWFWDLAALALVEHLTLQGIDLAPGRSASDLDFAFYGAMRLGWNGRRLRPFVFLATSYSVPPRTISATGFGPTVPLSQINAEAGLGIAWGILP